MIGTKLIAATGGVLVLGQVAKAAAEAVGEATGWSILKLAAESLVGISLLICVVLMLRALAEKDKQWAGAVKAVGDEIAARFAERDHKVEQAFRDLNASNREVIDGFRADLARSDDAARKSLEAHLQLTREVVNAVNDVNHSVRALDATVRVLSERQQKLEHHVFLVAPPQAGAVAAPEEHRAIVGAPPSEPGPGPEEPDR